MNSLNTAILMLALFFSCGAFSAESSDSVELSETGAYRVSIGLFRPDFSEADNYEDFYDSPSLGAALFIEHYPWEWAVTLGYSIHVGYYQDSGKAGNAIGENIEQEKESPADFAMLPVQIALSLIATPFPESKWFTISGWFGFERTMFNETRRLDASSDEDEKKVFTNFGFKNATVVGGSLNVLVRGKTSSSVVDVMGLRRVFLSPYVEVVTSTEDEGLLLGGTRMGVAFSFELDAG